MGRELRQVPPNWEHPKDDNGRYQPMYDRYYLDELNEWWENHLLWEKGEHPYQNDDKPSTERYYAEVEGNPPDIDYYRKYTDDEATWFQLYETVSEGTPVTPPFPTKEDLVDYLVEYGDFWYQSDQERRSPYQVGRIKPTREQAKSLVETGFALSLVVQKTDNEVRMFDAYQQQDIKSPKLAQSE